MVSAPVPSHPPCAAVPNPNVGKAVMHCSDPTRASVLYSSVAYVTTDTPTVVLSHAGHAWVRGGILVPAVDAAASCLPSSPLPAPSPSTVVKPVHYRGRG